MKNPIIVSILILATISTLLQSHTLQAQNYKKTLETQIEISSGVIEGVDEDGIVVFRGILFAEPPVGDKRWTAPVDKESWNGVLETREFRHACSFPFLGI